MILKRKRQRNDKKQKMRNRRRKSCNLESQKLSKLLKNQFLTQQLGEINKILPFHSGVANSGCFTDIFSKQRFIKERGLN